MISQRLKQIFKNFLRKQGKELISIPTLEMYRGITPAARLYSYLDHEKQMKIAAYMPLSQSQLAQDLLALAICDEHSDGYFVEFGATDGFRWSNTWLLEKYLGWKGILCEPAEIWHEHLLKNRSCLIDTSCVAESSGHKTEFLEASQDSSPELSTVKSYAKSGDWASQIRQDNAKYYDVQTVSLNDLLDEYDAPNKIQFLSIDIEGSEADILGSFDFSKRQIKVVCVEHNYVEAQRAKIRKIMLNNGYDHVYPELSIFDDWYVLR